jgi:aldose 1-epimerase
VSPTVEVVRLGGGPIEVDVLPEIGARLHRLRVDGEDLLRTPPDLVRHLDDPYFWGSYPMAPWCNRIAAGRTPVAGHELDLPATFPDGTAIHGQVSQAPWTQVGDSSFRIRAGGDGWPWPYEVTQVIAIDGRAFRLELRLTNRADDAMPAGIGIHPWFRRPVRVAIGAAAAYPSYQSTDPEPRPVEGRFDRRRLEELPHGLDACWTDLSEPPIVLAWPEAGVRATVETSPPVRYVVAASPGEIDAVAVEPQTHAPAGIRRLLDREPGALILLDPGETLAMTVRFAFEAAKPDTP